MEDNSVAVILSVAKDLDSSDFYEILRMTEREKSSK